MALRLLGEPPIDLHAGGVDLVFPHHENEIAQAEGATGRPFSRFWMHVEFLNLDQEKMSKSLGNIFTVPDVLQRGYRASALRYLFLSVHYRKQLKFTWESLDQAEEALRRLMDFLARVDAVTAPGAHEAVTARVAEARGAFAGRMADDLNTAGALGVMFELVRAMNAAIDAGEIGAPDARARPRGVRRVRPRARRSRAPARRGSPAARARRDHRALIEERRAAETAPLRASRPAPRRPRGAGRSCSRTRRPARGGNGSKQALGSGPGGAKWPSQSLEPKA